jgi:iron(III) transport system substrate-binding protein
MAGYSRRTFLTGSAGLAVAAGLAACGPGPASTPAAPASGAAAPAADTADALEAAARAEGGELLLYVIADSDPYMVSPFTKQYPWAKVSTYGATAAAIVSRVILEATANIKGGDLFQSSPGQRAEFNAKHAGQPTPGLPNVANVIPEFIDPENIFFPYIQTPVSLTYNTSLLKAGPPADPFDLSKPEWKGKFAVDSPQNLSDGAEWLIFHRKAWGDDKWMTWLQGLKDNDTLITSGASASYTAVLQGQRTLCPDTVNDIVGQAAGTPMKLALADGVSPHASYLARSANAPHPKMAKFYLNWLLSRQGQQGIIDSGRLSTIENMPRTAAQNAVLPAGVSWIQSPSTLTDMYQNPQQYITIFNQFWPAT